MSCRLSCDSYHKNISCGLSFLQQEEEFVDMTIAAAGHLVKVHKNLLALASPYIKAMLQSVPRSEHPVIFLSNIGEDVLELILEYVYTGEVVIPTEKLEQFLKDCRDLHIVGIQNIVPPKLSRDAVINTRGVNGNESLITTSKKSSQLTNVRSDYDLSHTKENKEKSANTADTNNYQHAAKIKITAPSDNPNFEIINSINNAADCAVYDENLEQHHTRTTNELANAETGNGINSVGDEVVWTIGDALKENLKAYLNLEVKASSQIKEINNENENRHQSQVCAPIVKDVAKNIIFKKLPGRKKMIARKRPAIQRQLGEVTNPKASLLSETQDILAQKDLKYASAHDSNKKRRLDFEQRISAHVIDSGHNQALNHIHVNEPSQDGESQIISAPYANQILAARGIMSSGETIGNVNNDTGREYNNLIDYVAKEHDERTVEHENGDCNNVNYVAMEREELKLEHESYQNSNVSDIHVQGENIEQSEMYELSDIEVLSSPPVNLETALSTHTIPKVSYNVNVQLPGGSQNQPHITITPSLQIQNNSVPIIPVSPNPLSGSDQIDSKMEPREHRALVQNGTSPLFMVNSRGCLQMILNRFIYSIHHKSKRDSRWRWRCIDYRHQKCRAYTDTVGDLVVARKGAHQHPFHDEKILALGSSRSVYSSLHEIREKLGVALEDLSTLDLGVLNE